MILAWRTVRQYQGMNRALILIISDYNFVFHHHFISQLATHFKCYIVD